MIRSRTRLRWLGRFALLFLTVATVVGLAVAAEMAYRKRRLGSFSLCNYWTTDPDLVYRLNPENPEFPGSFRGKAPAPVKSSGKTRIFCLGGSTTFGHQVEFAAAWPTVLERLLQEKGIDAEIFNAGAPGYGSRHHLIQYRRDIARMSPDVILIHCGWNRVGIIADPDTWMPPVIPNPHQRLDQRLVMKLGSASLLFRTFLRLEDSDIPGKRPRQIWYHPELHDVFMQDVRQLVGDVLANRQLPVLILYPSLLHEGMTPAEIAQYETAIWDRKYEPIMIAALLEKHRALRQIAGEAGVPSIDLQRGFAPYRGKERLVHFMDEMHTTVPGNRLVAELLADTLAPILRKPDPAPRPR